MLEKISRKESKRQIVFQRFSVFVSILLLGTKEIIDH